MKQWIKVASKKHVICCTRNVRLCCGYLKRNLRRNDLLCILREQLLELQRVKDIDYLKAEMQELIQLDDIDELIGKYSD